MVERVGGERCQGGDVRPGLGSPKWDPHTVGRHPAHLGIRQKAPGASGSAR